MTETPRPTEHQVSPGGEDSLGKFFALALSAHALAFGALLFASYVLDVDLLSKEDLEMAQLVQSSVRVDVVAMPKLTIQELKQAQPDKAGADQADEDLPVSAPKDADSEVEFKTEKKVELSSLLSSLSARKVDSKPERRRKGPSLSAKELNSLVMEGNKVSQGQALVGDALAQAEGEFASYVAAIPGYVRPHWTLPSYLMDKNLRARVRIFISSEGEIVKSEIFQSSGVEEFDRRALGSLRQAGPLPVPPKSIQASLAGGKVVLGFPL